MKRNRLAFVSVESGVSLHELLVGNQLQVGEVWRSFSRGRVRPSDMEYLNERLVRKFQLPFIHDDMKTSDIFRNNLLDECRPVSPARLNQSDSVTYMSADESLRQRM